MTNSISKQLKQAALELNKEVRELKFAPPVSFVYNPLEYAWQSYSMYIEKYCQSKKKIILMGMNPGPWGMAQTGVPFGEIDAVKQWLNIQIKVNKPYPEHPKRPIDGFLCQRSEVSGRRLWGLFKERFDTAEHFFQNHFVANYCPLVFMEESARNRTPDKLKPEERKLLFNACDHHLRRTVEILEPRLFIGVGKFARDRAEKALQNSVPGIQIASILHPSPASPAANHDWAGTVTRQFQELKVWD